MVINRNFIETLNYIEQNFAAVTFSDAAKFAGYSPSYFSRLFCEMTGNTFTDYLNAVKVRSAYSHLMKAEENVTAIALRCGFASIRNFNRVFKQLTGRTPSEIQNEKEISAPVKVQGEDPSSIFNPTLGQSELISVIC